MRNVYFNPYVIATLLCLLISGVMSFTAFEYEYRTCIIYLFVGLYFLVSALFFLVLFIGSKLITR